MFITMRNMSKRNLKIFFLAIGTIALALGYMKLGHGFLVKLFIFITCSLIGMAGMFFDNSHKRFAKINLFIYSFLCLYLFVNNIVNINFGFYIERILGDVVSIILATNTDEITAFLKNFSSYDYIKASYPLIGMACMCLGYSIDYSFKIEKGRLKMLFLISICSFVGLIVLPNFTFSNLVRNIPIFLDEIDSSIKYAEEKKHFLWNAHSKVKGNSTVVVIVGETTRGDHMSLNGYHRNTTPNLMKEDIISFKNAISIGSHTLASTPYIFTRKPVSDEWTRRLFPEKSFISAFKEAGYETYYISYLNKVHAGDNAINQIVNEADNYIKRDGKYDETGITVIDNILKKNNSKKLIVYKLIGSHYHFQDRYPKSYDEFKPSFTEVEFNGPDVSDKQVFINTYDNSILYTDNVVSQILEKLKKVSGDVTLSFISDHGISIYEDDKTVYHGTKKANYNIPLFFWFNDVAKNRLGSVTISILKENTNYLVDQSYFCETIMDLNGIDIGGYSKSLLKKHNFNKEVLVIKGFDVVNYNTIEGSLAY